MKTNRKTPDIYRNCMHQQKEPLDQLICKRGSREAERRVNIFLCKLRHSSYRMSHTLRHVSSSQFCCDSGLERKRYKREQPPPPLRRSIPARIVQDAFCSGKHNSPILYIIRGFQHPRAIHFSTSAECMPPCPSKRQST
jgi:hypothetical protein